MTTIRRLTTILADDVLRSAFEAWHHRPGKSAGSSPPTADSVAASALRNERPALIIVALDGIAAVDHENDHAEIFGLRHVTVKSGPAMMPVHRRSNLAALGDRRRAAIPLFRIRRTWLGRLPVCNARGGAGRLPCLAANRATARDHAGRQVDYRERECEIRCWPIAEVTIAGNPRWPPPIPSSGAG